MAEHETPHAAKAVAGRQSTAGAREVEGAGRHGEAEEFWLQVVEGDGIGRSLRFAHTQATIGRCNSCAFRIADMSASRIHCVAWLDSSGPRIKDVSSTNGTFVNGEHVGAALLAIGDSVQIGDTVLIVTAASGKAIG